MNFGLSKFRSMSHFTVTPEYVEDPQGNRNHISHFGSLEAAKAALETLHYCWRCIDSTYLSNCQDCSNCSWVKGKQNSRDLRGTPIQVPKIDGIHQKVLELASKPGALIHRHRDATETARTWDGWIVFLGGEGAARLVDFFGPINGNFKAAKLILRESSTLKFPETHLFLQVSDSLQVPTTLKLMRELAEAEKRIKSEPFLPKVP